MHNPFAIQAFGETYAEAWWPPLPDPEPWELDYKEECYWDYQEYLSLVDAYEDELEFKFGSLLSTLPVQGA